MASKKCAAKEKRRHYKKLVLSFLRANGEEDAHARGELVGALAEENSLSKDERNSLDQLISRLIERAVINLDMIDGCEYLRLEDADRTISEPKRKKRRTAKGKTRRYKMQPRGKHHSTAGSTTTETSSALVYSSDSDEDAD
nr:uncharacterized protein LOC113828925 [Penaeus vannamei]